MIRTLLPLAVVVALGVVLAVAQPPAVRTSAQPRPAAQPQLPTPPPPADTTASSATVLQPLAAGSVHAYGMDVQYLFVKTDLPGSTRLALQRGLPDGR